MNRERQVLLKIVPNLQSRYQNQTVGLLGPLVAPHQRAQPEGAFLSMLPAVQLWLLLVLKKASPGKQLPLKQSNWEPKAQSQAAAIEEKISH